MAIDARIRSTGRHPNLEGMVSWRAGEAQRDRNIQRQVKELEALARDNTAVPDPVGQPIATVHDAAYTLGLDAEKSRHAYKLIGQVVKDARDMIAVSKAAREAGIPSAIIPELLRRGFALHMREKINADRIAKATSAAPARPPKVPKTAAVPKGAKPAKTPKAASATPKGLPLGTVRDWNGKQMRKIGPDQWEPVGGGLPRRKADPTEAPAGKGAAAPAAAGGAAATAPAEPGPITATKEPDPGVRARYLQLQARGKKVGLNVRGMLHPNHSHEHLDQLEGLIRPHEDAKAKAEGKAPAPPMVPGAAGAAAGGGAKSTPGGVAAPGGGAGQPGAPGASPAGQGGAGSSGQTIIPPDAAGQTLVPHGWDTPLPESPEAQIPRDAQGRPVGSDEPGKNEPHEVQRLRVAISNVEKQLQDAEAHLDSPEMKALHKRLLKEGDQIKRKPSYQASEWYKHRSLSFLAMLTGAAVGAAMAPLAGGAVAGALAGGVEGKASKVEVTPGAQANEEEARKVAGAKQKQVRKPAEEPEKPKADQVPVKQEVKKAVRLVMIGNRPMFQIGGVKSEGEFADQPGMGSRLRGQPHAAAELVKGLAPSGGGWHPVPRSTTGAMRRRNGVGWEYWTPGDRNPQAHPKAAENGAEHADRQTSESANKAIPTHAEPHTPGVEAMPVKLVFVIDNGDDRDVTEKPVTDYTVRDELRALSKSAGVLVNLKGDQITLTGDLVKAGVPDFMLDVPGSHHIAISKDEARILRDTLRKQGSDHAR